MTLIWGCSSPGRAFGSQSKGSRFKSGQLQTKIEEPLIEEQSIKNRYKNEEVFWIDSLKLIEVFDV